MCLPFSPEILCRDILTARLTKWPFHTFNLRFGRCTCQSRFQLPGQRESKNVWLAKVANWGFSRFEGLVIRPNAPSAEIMPSIFSKMLPCSSCSLARQLVTPKCLSPLVGGLLSNPQPVQIYELRTKLLFWGKCVTKCGGSPIGYKVLDVRDINIKAAACNLHCGWFDSLHDRENGGLVLVN